MSTKRRPLTLYEDLRWSQPSLPAVGPVGWRGIRMHLPLSPEFKVAGVRREPEEPLTYHRLGLCERQCGGCPRPYDGPVVQGRGDDL